MPTNPNSGYVNGVGCLSPYGIGTLPLFKASLSGETHQDGGFARISDIQHQEFLAELTKNPRWNKLQESKKELVLSNIPLSWSLLAIWQAMDQAQWQELDDTDGFIMATTTGELPAWEKPLMNHFLNKPDDSPMLYIPVAHLQFVLRDILNHRGPFTMLNSACAASTQALGVAQSWLSTGKVDRCLVGGVEKLCRLTETGFSSLSLVSTEPCQPFDKNRQGINLSEAAAFFCMSHKKEGTTAQILAGGYSCDAGSMTAPDEQGRGCYRAMASALKKSGLLPKQIDWVHAHGTGSKLNDQAESQAISALFTDCDVPVSSTKRIHGHALGASGSLETALCVEAIKQKTLVKSSGSENIDENIKVNVLKNNLSRPINYILKNTLGFGGINSSLVIGKVES